MPRPDNNTTVPKSKLRWFQYRLSTLLLLITAAAIWLSFWTNQVRKQKEAVEFITRHGGSIEYTYQVNAGSNKPTPPGPTWLRNLLGIDYFDHVVNAYFCGDFLFTDADLERLQGLPDLEYLQIASSNVTDNGLSHLKYLHGLKELELRSEKITDAGLVHLQPLTELTELTLDCSITDAGMANLMPLKKLSKLYSRGFTVDSNSWRAVNALRGPTTIECFEPPLPQVCEYLGNYHNFKFQFDKAALKDMIIDVDPITCTNDVPITCTLKNVPLDIALHAILEPLCLDWYLGQNAMVITTRDIVAKRHKGVEKLQKSLPNLQQAYVDW
jgi:hypothetical protein